MTDITELAQSKSLRKKLNRRLNDAYGFQRTSGGKHTTIILSIAECKSVIAALEKHLALVEALEKAQQRIDELENDEVRQRLANAEHQLYMAELAKHNLKASRKAQFRKRRAAEKRIAELEFRTVKLPDELSGETLLDNYSDVAYSDDTGVLEYTNIIGCFVKITAPPDKVIRFRWSDEGMHIRLVDRVKTHEHAGIIVDFPKNYKDFIQ